MSMKEIDFAKELNAEQYAVATAGPGAHLVLAGAGTGKTRAIIYHVAWLLQQGVKPEEIVLLTFTNKAAREMMMRAETLLGLYPGRLWAGTFHSIANRLLRMYGAYTSFGSSFSLLDEDDSRDLLNMCVKDTGAKAGVKKFPSAGVIGNAWSYARNARVPLATALARRAGAFEEIVDKIEMVVQRYEVEKMQQRVMDFDDLLLRFLDLLRDPHICTAIATRFTQVLVDEFQDTNLIQADIVHALQSVHKNLVVVGDDAQSIYSFRAARIENILDFTARYPQATTHRLVVNYRSTPEILAVVNAVIAGNEKQFPKDLVAVKPKGKRPLILPCADDRAEAREVASRIAALLQGGTPVQEMAVLFRSTFHSQAIEFELLNRGVAYDYRGGMKFFERAHIKDALAHLRVLRNVRDGVAWLRIAQLHAGVGLTAATTIARHVAHCATVKEALYSTPKLSAKATQGWTTCANILQTMVDMALPAEAIRALVTNHIYRDYLTAEYENARERRDDLEQFARFAEEYDDIGAFLDAVTLTGDFGGLNDTERGKDHAADLERVVLSTVHQAKGLEWEHVFILHAAEGFFPSEKSYDDDNGIEEERRLFYVAVTRAKKEVTIAYPQTSGFDRMSFKQPSTFIEEIPRELLEMKQQVQPSTTAWNTASDKRTSPSPSFVRRGMQDDGWEDETIVIDDLGETAKIVPVKKSFLMDV